MKAKNTSAKICPETGKKVVYLICNECEYKGRCHEIFKEEKKGQ